MWNEAVHAINAEYARAWSFDEGDLNRPGADRVLGDLINRIAPDHQVRLTEEYFGVGPIQTLIDDPLVTEIVIDGPDEVWCERGGIFHKHDDCFLSETTFRNFIERFGTEAQIKTDLAQPFADGRWRGFRVHLGRAPLTRASFHLTLRRTAAQPWTLERLIEAGWCDTDSAHILTNLVRERRNVLVIGPTGAGKTSVLNALLRITRDCERTVILEDTDELSAPNPASTKMLTRAGVPGHLPEVTLADLLRQSLRMRPDRLVVGEVRGPEAKDLLMSLSTGHAGSFGTLHAANPRQALLRLEMLVHLGAPQWNLETLRRLIHLSVDALVTCDFSGGRRRLGGVSRVAGLETFGLLLEEII